MAKPVGRVLRDLRIEAGLTRAQVARAAGLDPAAVSKVEDEEREHVRFTTVCQLARALDVTVDEIAVRVGLIRPKSTAKGRPSGTTAEALTGLTMIEKLLNRASAQAAALRKKIIPK